MSWHVVYCQSDCGNSQHSDDAAARLILVLLLLGTSWLLAYLHQYHKCDLTRPQVTRPGSQMAHAVSSNRIKVCHSCVIQTDSTIRKLSLVDCWLIVDYCCNAECTVPWPSVQMLNVLCAIHFAMSLLQVRSDCECKHCRVGTAAASLSCGRSLEYYDSELDFPDIGSFRSQRARSRSAVFLNTDFPKTLPQCLSLIHIWRCRRSTLCRSRWSPYH